MNINIIFKMIYFFILAYKLKKPHILFYGDFLAVWYGFPDITHITHIVKKRLEL